MRASVLLFGTFKKQKYPFLVSYQQLPWTAVEPGSELAHKTIAPHVRRLLAVTASSRVPQLLCDSHPALPQEKWLSHLPGTLYFAPIALTELATAETSSSPASPTLPSWSPFGWQPTQVTSDRFLTHYGPLHRFATVKRVFELMSPDLRLSAIAVGFEKVVATTSQRGGEASATTLDALKGNAFSFFYFYRPNRPPSELVAPFQRYYGHDRPTDVESALPSSSFQPVLRPPKRDPARSKASPMPAAPPLVTAQHGLNERLAIIPGDCFGRRELQWGSGW